VQKAFFIEFQQIVAASQMSVIQNRPTGYELFLPALIESSSAKTCPQTHRKYPGMETEKIFARVLWSKSQWTVWFLKLKASWQNNSISLASLMFLFHFQSLSTHQQGSRRDLQGRKYYINTINTDIKTLYLRWLHSGSTLAVDRTTWSTSWLRDLSEREASGKN
jgi:hypothetical protein